MALQKTILVHVLDGANQTNVTAFMDAVALLTGLTVFAVGPNNVPQLIHVKLDNPPEDSILSLYSLIALYPDDLDNCDVEPYAGGVNLPPASRGSRKYLVPEPVVFPVDGGGMTLIGTARSPVPDGVTSTVLLDNDTFSDVVNNQNVNVLGYSPTPVTEGFCLRVVGTSHSGADKVSWQASDTFGTNGSPNPDVYAPAVDDVGAKSCRLRIDDRGVPALQHSGAIEFQLPWSGTPYSFNKMLLEFFLKFIPPTNSWWKDTVRITMGKLVTDITISFAPGPLTTTFSQNGISLVMDVSGKRTVVLTGLDKSTAHLVAGDTVAITNAPNGADDGTYTIDSIDGAYVLLTEETDWNSGQTTVDLTAGGATAIYAAERFLIIPDGTLSATERAHMVVGDTITVANAAVPANDGVYSITDIQDFGDLYLQLGTGLSDWGTFGGGDGTTFTLTFATSGAIVGGLADAEFTFGVSGAYPGSFTTIPAFSLAYTGQAPVNSDNSLELASDLWSRCILSINGTINVPDATHKYVDVEVSNGQDGGALKVMTLSDKTDSNHSQATPSTYLVKIERILSDPPSGAPEECGTVDTYFGPISMLIDNITL